MKKIKVVVLMGGRSPKHEVSLVTGREVVRNLDKKKYEILPVLISRDGERWQLKDQREILLHSPSRVEKTDHKRRIRGGKALLPQGRNLPLKFGKKPDVVFIAMHGPYGEDGTVQGMLELAGLPYTGAGVLASALGMDKPMFRRVIEERGIPTPEYLVFEKGENSSIIWKKFKTPLVVKPSSQGSSVGVSIVRRKEELDEALKKAFNFGPRVIIEEYLSGTEVTCGVLGNENPQALPVVEIVPKKEFFDYEAKYDETKCDEIVPARISRKLTKKVQDLAIRVFKAIDCRGFGRVDMIISQGKPFVLEINTIPGLTPVSLFPKEASAAGISYSELLDRIISLALENH
ncbi:MAG: D-alanine--D-alanine ligase family protein [Patescibacteria group bacterium]